jgi:hypothetical protein
MTGAIVEVLDLSAPPPGYLTKWGVRHVGIKKVVPCWGKAEAEAAAGTAGVVVTRDSVDEPWREWRDA